MKPVAVAMEDMNAIAGAMVAVQGLQIAIVTLQKELDSANAESQRALARAQAKHPNMPINTKTWVYMPASKTEAPTPGGRR